MEQNSDSESFVAQRSKRQKVDKSALFEQLKKLKGSKNKYQLTEIENVYDTIDENEFSKRVLDAKNEKWIIDDGSGYVEDGREIFDDDCDDYAEPSTSRTPKKKPKKKVCDPTVKGNIRNLIAKMPDNNKKESVKVPENDDILDSLLSEDMNGKTNTSTLYDEIENEKRAVNDYLGSFSVSQDFVLTRKKIVKRTTPSLKRKLQDSPTPAIMDESDSVFEDSVNTFETKLSENTNLIENENLEQKIDEFHLSDIMDDYDFDIGDSDFVLPDNNDTDKPFVEEMESEIEQLHLNNEDVFQFYWLDVYEDPYHQPGVVFFFGKKRLDSKSREYESCCVIVRNIRKTAYFLMKNGVEENDLIEELDLAVFPSKFKETQHRVVTKKYVFDTEVPEEAKYMEVQYPATFPSIEHCSKGAYYTKVFGANQSCLEAFLLKKKLRGPCWLQVRNARKITNPMSHCKCEIVCENDEDLIISEHGYNMLLPEIVALTIDFYLLQNPKSSKSEIVMISCIFDKKFLLDKSLKDLSSREYFCAFTKPSHKLLPLDMQKLKDIELRKNCKFVKFDSERALLSCFLAKLTQYDPDIIIGHDLFGLKINMLCDRIKDLSLSQWSHLGRLRRITKIQKMNSFHLYKTALIGRLVCDLKIAAKDSSLKCRSYDLETLSKTILKSKLTDSEILEINIYNIEKMFSSSKSIMQLMYNIFSNTDLTLRMILEIKAIPLALQITKIAGNVLSATLHGGRSERNEFLLLHAFTEKGYIVPDKISKTAIIQEGANKKDKTSYEGGLVLDPKVGLYDAFILLMDFNSLYPSIIQEFNICFTTIRSSEATENDLNIISNLDLGILPIEIQKLVEARKQVKKLMKTPKLSDDARLQYNIRQMALKLTANSMYGCLGFSGARFYAKHLAALITKKGREILMNTRDFAEKNSYEVIYGDTDSIMINTNTQDFEKVNKIALKLKSEINKQYRFVEIDIDGIYKSLLLLKKKKYAGLLIKRANDDKFKLDLELKGLDMVRRDWSQISAKASEIVVKEILSDKPFEERIQNIYQHMEKLKNDIIELRIPLVMFEITKQITKDLRQYKTNVQSLPHVVVALRLSQKKNYRKGDTVSYVICDNGTKLPAVQRAYHLDELKEKDTDLKIDTTYYLTQQIFPVVLRLCESVEGIDLSHLAKCLNVTDYTVHRLIENPKNNDFPQYNIETSTVSNKTFSFQCINCKTIINVKSGFIQTSSSVESLPFIQVPCSQPDCKTLPIEYLDFLENQLILTINSYITFYYNAPLLCNNGLCNIRTAIRTNRTKNYQMNCRSCRKGVLKKEFTAENLYDTLLFLKSLFSLSSVDKLVNLDEEFKSALNRLEVVVDHYLSQSSYNVHDFKVVFGKYNEQIQNRFWFAFNDVS